MAGLYDLTVKAQAADVDAMEQIIERFQPKIKKSAHYVPFNFREDLEQELRIQVVKAILRFEIHAVSLDWGFRSSLNRHTG